MKDEVENLDEPWNHLFIPLVMKQHYIQCMRGYFHLRGVSTTQEPAPSTDTQLCNLELVRISVYHLKIQEAVNRNPVKQLVCMPVKLCPEAWACEAMRAPKRLQSLDTCFRLSICRSPRFQGFPELQKGACTPSRRWRFTAGGGEEAARNCRSVIGVS